MLFTTTSGAGHFLPLVPLAEAARAAGHDVAVAAPEESTAMVEGAGFAHLPFGGVPPDDPGRAEVFRQRPTLSEQEARALFGREIFGRLNTSAALPGTTRAVSEWQPDLVVSEAAEFSGLLAAEVVGLPRLRVHRGSPASGSIPTPPARRYGPRPRSPTSRMPSTSPGTTGRRCCASGIHGTGA